MHHHAAAAAHVAAAHHPGDAIGLAVVAVAFGVFMWVDSERRKRRRARTQADTTDNR